MSPAARMARRIFIAAPGDLAEERRIAVKTLQTLALEAPGDPIEVFAYEHEERVWDPGGHWQTQIPRPGRDGYDLVVCMFGERLGNPLPDDGLLGFPLPDEVTYGPHHGRFPLTGTMYEFLESLDSHRWTGYPKLLLYFKGDSSILDRSRSYEQRNWGDGAHYHALEQEWKRRGHTIGIPPRQSTEYWQQIEWLANFVDWHTATSPQNGIFRERTEFEGRLEADLRERLGFVKPLAKTAGKGLHWYDVSDKNLLFGRDSDVRDLVETLRSADTSAHRIPMLVLSGPSGSGKSSTVRAGLAARLQDGSFHRTVGADFLPFLFTPGDLSTKDPFQALLQAFGPQVELTDVSSITGAVASLANALGGRRVLVAIDQIEEMLAMSSPHPAWEQVIELLGEVAANRIGYSVVVIKKEWLPLWTAHPAVRSVTSKYRLCEEEFPDNLEKGTIISIIRRTFQAAGFTIESGLLEHMWLEFRQLEGRSESVLPLLSVAMGNMAAEWDRRNEKASFGSARNLDDSYREHASLRVVVGNLGDACLAAALGSTEQLAHILRSLVSMTVDGESRRRSLLTQPLSSFRPADQGLLTQLAEKRLLHRERDTVRLAHDTILEHWDKARDWWEQEKAHVEVRTDVMSLMRIGVSLPPQMLDRAQRMIVDWREEPGVEPESNLSQFVRRSMDQFFEPNRPFTDDGELRLSDAIRLGDAALVMRMLDAGVDVNLGSRRADYEGRTALMVAASTGREDLIDTLLDRGAWINAQDNESSTAILLGAYWGQSPVVRQLLARGASVLTNKNGWSVLMVAAWRGYQEIVDVLLAQGADLDQTDPEGWSALTAAIHAGHAGLARRLVDSGAALTRVNDKVETAAFLAAIYGDGGLMESILRRGVEPSEVSLSGATLLTAAADNNRLEVVEALLRDPRVDVRTTDRAGRSPLVIALAKGHSELAGRLIDAGAVLPFFYERNADGTVTRRSREDLVSSLRRQLLINPDGEWPMPPLTEGAWSAAPPEEAAGILADALTSMPYVLEDVGSGEVEALRRTNLPFYEGATLFEARIRARGLATGYLTFVYHPLGYFWLNGTSTVIHEMNARFPVHLDTAEFVASYLRFFCHSIQGDGGVFLLLEDASRLSWTSPGETEEKQAIAVALSRPTLLVTPAGSDWVATAMVRYDHGLFRASFLIRKSGMVEMLDDVPLALGLTAKIEKFSAGLRVWVETAPPDSFVTANWFTFLSPGQKGIKLLDRFVNLHGAAWTWPLSALKTLASVALQDASAVSESTPGSDGPTDEVSADLSLLSAEGWVVTREEAYELTTDKLAELNGTVAVFPDYFTGLSRFVDQYRSWIEGPCFLIHVRIMMEVHEAGGALTVNRLRALFTGQDSATVDKALQELIDAGLVNDEA